MRENSVNARKQEFGLGGGLGQGAGRGTVTMRDLPSAMWRALASPNANLRGAHTILFCVHTQKLYSTSHRAYSLERTNPGDLSSFAGTTVGSGVRRVGRDQRAIPG